MSTKKVLIVAYRFPPYPGIGGRRWAKFAKYLHNKGVDIHIITAQNPFNEISSWEHDVVNIQENITRLSPSFPKALQIIPKNIFQKIGYKIALFCSKLFLSGNNFDSSGFWGRKLKKEAIKWIIAGYNNVIVTGPPFHYMYFLAGLKNQFPHMNLILDFRDEWTDDHRFGMEAISVTRKEREKKMELFALTKANAVISPSEFILKRLVEKHQLLNIFHFPHGIDSEEIPQKVNEMNEAIKIIYGGTLYDGMKVDIQNLCENLINSQAIKDFSFYFYTTPSSIYRKEFKNVSQVKFLEPLGSRQYLKEMASSDYVLIMYPDKLKDFFSAKFYELLALRKPILYLGAHGKVADFIIENNLGIKWDYNDPGFLEKLKTPPNINRDFDLSPYTYDQLTQKLISILK